MPAVFEHVGADPVAQLQPLRALAPPVLADQLHRPVHGQPAHHLGVHVVPRRQPGLPQPVVGFVPAAFDGGDHRLDDPPLLVAHRAAHLGHARDQVGDRPEHIELQLAVGGVADAHRPRPGVPGQRVDDRLGAQVVPVHRVQRVQPLRVPAGALDAPVHPAEVRLRLGQRAEIDQDAGGHRRVAQPAVPVVPVAHAADLLRQRAGRRREDRAGRLVAQAAQRQGAAQHVVAGDRGQLQGRGPVPPFPLDPGLAGRHRLVPRAQVVGTAPKFERALPAQGGQVDLGARRVVPAVVVDVPFHAGRVQRHRLVGAEYEQPVAQRLEPDRHLPVLRPGRELDAGPDGAGQPPYQRGGRRCIGLLAARHAAVQPVGDGQPGPAGLHGERARPVPLPERHPVAYRRPHREVPGRAATDKVGEDRGGVRWCGGWTASSAARWVPPARRTASSAASPAGWRAPGRHPAARPPDTRPSSRPARS